MGQSGDPITFDEFLSGTFRPKYYNGTWWSNNEIQWKDTDGNLVLFNIDTETVTILVSKEVLDDLGSARFLGFAPNSETLQLFASNIESNWRHSFFAEYSILDSNTGSSYPLVPQGMPATTKLQYAEWLPHPFEDRIVFVYQNNIYVRFDALSESSTVQITTDGIVDNFYNGIPDWVYEEEVLSTNKAMYYSSSGSKLAYAQFDDRLVEEFHYTKYGDPYSPYDNQYPTDIMVKYPKVGTVNPTIKLLVKDLENIGNPPSELVPPPEVINYGEYIYTSATWKNDGSKGIA